MLRNKSKFHQLANGWFGFSNSGLPELSAMKIEIHLLPPPLPLLTFSSAAEFANLSLVEIIKYFYKNNKTFLKPNISLRIKFCQGTWVA